MTEAEWLACADPVTLLDHLRTAATDRKARLFICGYSRAVWDHTWPQRCRRVVEVAERFADGAADADELGRARSGACEAAHDQVAYGGRGRTGPAARVVENRLFFAADAALPLRPLLPYRYYTFRHDSRSGPVALPLVRCVFGNPFRPVRFDPVWRTSAALALGETIYADRLFDRLPILADALEEAGCDDADLLAHCRGDGPHARGCWAVDAVLGRS